MWMHSQANACVTIGQNKPSAKGYDLQKDVAGQTLHNVVVDAPIYEEMLTLISCMQKGVVN
jgi:hypothetical protein